MSVPWGWTGDHRGASRFDHYVLTPENRHPSRLPWVGSETSVCLLASPRGRAAGWGAYHLVLPAQTASSRIPRGLEHFIYVLQGDITLDSQVNSAHLDGHGAFAYITPAEDGFSWSTVAGAEMLWFKRPYASLPGASAPTTFVGHRDRCAPVEDKNVPGGYLRQLLPVAQLEHDFAVNLVSLEPGVAFDQVEIHDEDHGLYVTHGEGVYLLGEHRYRVKANDFIYLAPYCPQHFAAVGSETAEYLLYKPANRDGFE